ncbi:glutamate--tRNA ligase [Varunaivibrio sulfuroxidans]|uniref:Glutamate--tRNA ligase n=1 Tax=Varunaivibrio sulfuroxidans TaxID=1773489 RepID=A0A4R3JEF6_9PROT|nr:glutamate--tRNA ligase [Varunaivibrio sulfuroxidans]TCS64177.1 glutamyl-tRNA synthetase [Varunaivibrio sulfuroxidans]WES31377.1 glutamate--tRNA ligase [Varunaivibrio sulfuroxidans]
MTVVTRFAPSPTGFLHIGGARTALFNWLYARHCGGKFLLRIEDTDRKRSTQEAVDAIIDGMKWLGLDWDGDAISQYARAARHREVAEQLLGAGMAYKCYATPDELTSMREQAKAEGRPMRYDGRWRDRDPKDAPGGVDPVVRLKAAQDGQTVIRDLIQGDVTVDNAQLDDMVLLRADGTPTYMLAVVVDDHDMEVTHVVRGDDHLTNTFRQLQIYTAMGWDRPIFAHMPLLHGADGAKLSKRHGALGVEAYRDMGFLPEALCNYLLRLGWGHGDDEIISRRQAIEWFDLKDVGRAATRFDMAKLTSLNAHYIRTADDQRLSDLALRTIAAQSAKPAGPKAQERILSGMPGLKERAKTIVELAESALFYAFDRPIEKNEKALKLLEPQSRAALGKLLEILKVLPQWREEDLEQAVKGFAEAEELKLGKIAQPLRAALSGSNVSPGIFEVMRVLGREETLGRIDDAVNGL